MTIAVIGAGPAGLAAAYCLARDGADVEVPVHETVEAARVAAAGVGGAGGVDGG